MTEKRQKGGPQPGSGRPRKMPVPLVVGVPGVQRISDMAIPVFCKSPPRVAATPPPAVARPPDAPKKTTDPEELDVEMEPMEFLELVMHGKIDASPAQVGAAKALMAYKHKKAAEEGKKAAALAKARETMSAPRFGAPVPPGRPALKAA